MRQVTRKGLLSVAAAGGVLVMSAGVAHADSDATGASKDSPGVASGNTAQVPVSAPVNLCGNTFNVVGLLNPAMGNRCVNDGGAKEEPGHGGGGGGGGGADGGAEQRRPDRDGGGADADGVASGSPGVGSGNQAQVPVEVPVEACGNSVNVVGALNSVSDNGCVNASGPQRPAEPEKPKEPGEPERPSVPAPQEPDRPAEPDEGQEAPDVDDAQKPADDAAPQELANTGAGLELVAMVPLGAGLLLGGALLYRRRGARPARRG